MAKTKRTPTRATRRRSNDQFDGVYLFKLVLYLLLGSLWLKMSNGHSVKLDIPIGLMAGLFFAAHEHFRIDRKIEYAILLAAMLVGYFAPFGLYIGF